MHCSDIVREVDIVMHDLQRVNGNRCGSTEMPMRTYISYLVLEVMAGVQEQLPKMQRKSAGRMNSITILIHLKTLIMKNKPISESINIRIFYHKYSYLNLPFLIFLHNFINIIEALYDCSLALCTSHHDLPRNKDQKCYFWTLHPIYESWKDFRLVLNFVYLRCWF